MSIPKDYGIEIFSNLSERGIEFLKDINRLENEFKYEIPIEEKTNNPYFAYTPFSMYDSFRKFYDCIANYYNSFTPSTYQRIAVFELYYGDIKTRFCDYYMVPVNKKGILFKEDKGSLHSIFASNKFTFEDRYKDYIAKYDVEVGDYFIIEMEYINEFKRYLCYAICLVIEDEPNTFEEKTLQKIFIKIRDYFSSRPERLDCYTLWNDTIMIPPIGCRREESIEDLVRFDKLYRPILQPMLCKNHLIIAAPYDSTRKEFDAMSNFTTK